MRQYTVKKITLFYIVLAVYAFSTLIFKHGYFSTESIARTTSSTLQVSSYLLLIAAYFLPILFFWAFYLFHFILSSALLFTTHLIYASSIDSSASIFIAVKMELMKMAISSFLFCFAISIANLKKFGR